MGEVAAADCRCQIEQASFHFMSANSMEVSLLPENRRAEYDCTETGDQNTGKTVYFLNKYFVDFHA